MKNQAESQKYQLEQLADEYGLEFETVERLANKFKDKCDSFDDVIAEIENLIWE